MSPIPTRVFCFLNISIFFQQVFCTEAVIYMEYRVDMHGFGYGEWGPGAPNTPPDFPLWKDEAHLSRLNVLFVPKK